MARVPARGLVVLLHADIVDSTERADRLLARALELDPENFMALAMRAQLLVLIPLTGFRPVGRDAGEQALQLLARAREPNPRSDYVFCYASPCMYCTVSPRAPPTSPRGCASGNPISVAPKCAPGHSPIKPARNAFSRVCAPPVCHECGSCGVRKFPRPACTRRAFRATRRPRRQ